MPIGSRYAEGQEEIDLVLSHKDSDLEYSGGQKTLLFF